MRRHPPEHDEGSALVLALIVLLVLGLLVSAVLSFANTGLLTSPEIRNLRNLDNYTQGALAGAADAIRNNTDLGVAGTNCPAFNPTAPTNDPGADGGHTFTVQCEPKDNSSGPGVDQPQYAVLTLGSSPQGILQNNGNNTLTIDGGVFSHGDLAETAGNKANIIVKGPAYADGSCVGSVSATGGLNCGYGGPLPGADPEYPAAVSSSADFSNLIGTFAVDTKSQDGINNGADPPPVCTASGVAKFQPGYYTVLPSTLAAANTSCSGDSVYWFQPGPYFFDYGANWDLGSPHAITVIGGTPCTSCTWQNGASAPTLGSACQTSADGEPASADAPGVQFILAGGSTMSVTGSGGLELCAPMSNQMWLGSPIPGTPQRIALDGYSDPNSWTSGTTTHTNAGFDAAQSPGTSGTWVCPSGSGQTVTGSPCTAAPTKSDTDVLTYVPGASGLFQVPKGAKVTSATLVIAQSLTDARSTVTVTGTNGKSTSANFSDVNCLTPPYCSMSIPLSGGGNVVSGAAWRDLDNLAVVNSITGTKSTAGLATVNGIQLQVTYTDPAQLKQTCKDPCSFFQSTVNLNVYIHDTTYAPTSLLDVEVQNASGTIFSRGVVVASLHINVNASSTQQGAPFRLPKGTQNGRLVLFTALVDGLPKARTCVLYQDYAPNGSSTIAVPGYRMTIEHWSVLRVPDGQDPTCKT